ncbi:MAG: hypothetical protein OXF07_09205, partial [Rhodobacter sp.]|nr:hypothetical protein [Rhodobacter sp.]
MFPGELTAWRALNAGPDDRHDTRSLARGDGVRRRRTEEGGRDGSAMTDCNVKNRTVFCDDNIDVLPGINSEC